MSVRDHLSGLGMQDVAGRFTDDESLVGHLVQQYQAAQQQQQYAPYLQRYLAHAPDFEKYLAEQQQRQAAQQQPAPWWNPPQIQPGWEQLAAQDNAPPHIRAAVESYNQYRRDFAQKFLSNPGETLKPLIQQEARQIAGEMLQQNLGHLQERNTAREFVVQNQNWLYSRDAATGQTRLSPEGQRFQEFVVEAERLGIPGVQNQQTYALRLLGAGRQQQQPGVSQNQALKQNFLRQPNPAGAMNLSGPGTQPQPTNTPVNLGEALRRNMAAAGITDESLAAEMR